MQGFCEREERVGDKSCVRGFPQLSKLFKTDFDFGSIERSRDAQSNDFRFTPYLKSEAVVNCWLHDVLL
ncbi:MAG: hypothetical protein V7K95_08995 [Nostoc sp.]